MLFKCDLSSSIKGLNDKTEYLRCSSKLILYQMFKDCFKSKYSMYWGYETVVIKKTNLSKFPEIKQMRVN